MVETYPMTDREIAETVAKKLQRDALLRQGDLASATNDILTAMSEVRKPLVDALQESRSMIVALQSFIRAGEPLSDKDSQLLDTIDALVKVK